MKAPSDALATVERFNKAFNRHDVAAAMALMTDDCLFENTRSAPDGLRLEGSAAVRAYWEEVSRVSPQAHFTTEEIVAAGDRCVVRWTYSWVKEGTLGRVRGFDLFRVCHGRVAERPLYVKALGRDGA
jgi:ketosteroid isomerase-like protein